jgi:alkylation response protein AidB-like acyl-CoA dehydrogenase
VTASAPSIWRERAAEFADEVVAPLGVVLHRLQPAATPEGLVPLAEFIELASREGFTRLTDRVVDGGAGLSRAGEYEVLETLATADAGLTAVLTGIPLPFRLARRGPTQLRRRLGGVHLTNGPARHAGCIVAPLRGPLRLSRDETGWQLNGAALRATAGGVATHAVIACAAERSGGKPMVAIVALDRDGVSRMPPTPSPGLRGRIPWRLVFDHVRLEPEEVLDERHGGDRMAASLRAIDDLSAAVGCIGVARAAYEGAARWRTEHGLDATRRLARMRGELETARVAVRAAHAHEYARLDAGEAMSGPHALGARMLASRTAISLGRSAIALCGAQAGGDEGVTHRDGSCFQPAKLLLDATAGTLAEHGRTCPGAAIAAQRQRMGNIQWAT